MKIFIFVLLSCLSVNAQPTQESEKQYLSIKRSDFPDDFLFGTTTSAPQIEGSAKSEGKGPSVWDQFLVEFPDRIFDKSNLDVAADSYNRYKEDVNNLKEVGVDSYRFSIPWTRILPNGTLSGGVNQEGINHYNSLIDELVKIGVKPFVTLMHFDSPQILQANGGFLNQTIVNDFKDYAEICFKSFGDRVKYWVTINEPMVIAKMGYAMGVAPPGRCSDRKMCPNGNAGTEPYIAAHNLLLAHASAAQLYKQKYQGTQGGQIGLCNIAQLYEPYSNSQLDKEAAKRSLDFELGWFMEPLIYGDYPESMRRLVKDRLPAFSAEQKEALKGSFDFIAINYYTARYAKDIPLSLKTTPPSYLEDSNANVTVEKDGLLIGPNAGGSIFLYVYPQGLHKVLKFINENYSKNLTIYITENGYVEKSDNSVPVVETLKDQTRIEYVQKHLHQLKTAIADGINVKGYFYYSFIDSFEWGEGYLVRYGLYHVDFKNLTRSPKESAKWYSGFIKGGKI